MKLIFFIFLTFFSSILNQNLDLKKIAHQLKCVKTSIPLKDAILEIYEAIKTNNKETIEKTIKTVYPNAVNYIKKCVDEKFKKKIDSIKPDNLICMINKGSVKQNIDKLIIGFNRNNSITIAKAAEKLHKENKQYYDKCGIKMEEK